MKDLAEQRVSISGLHIVWLADMVVVADLRKSVAPLYQQQCPALCEPSLEHPG